MLKQMFSLLMALCLMLSLCVCSFAADNEKDSPCLHENADWQILSPATPVSDRYYIRKCPDCGLEQTAREARSSFIVRAFDLIARMFFTGDNYSLTESFSITAHTGPWELKQNGIPSLRYQLISGADVIEFDLNLNSEGTAVMAHGDPEKAGGTLDEGFALVSKYYGVKVNVDVKNTGAVRQAQELAIKYGILDRIFYTGVSEGDVPVVRENSPLVPYYLNVSVPSDLPGCEQLCEKAIALGAEGLNFSYTNYSPELASAAHSRGLLLSVYTVNKLRDLRTCLLYDVDNITTEFPYKLYTLTGRVKGSD